MTSFDIFTFFSVLYNTLKFNLSRSRFRVFTEMLGKCLFQFLDNFQITTKYGFLFTGALNFHSHKLKLIFSFSTVEEQLI